MSIDVETEVEAMARPKKGAKREQRPADEKVTIINMKGSEAYFRWFDDLHKRSHIIKTTLVRLALADWATKNGHPAPPEL